MTQMTKEEREIARVVHKGYFDRCKYAIENQFYFEALCMEYAAIEGRMKVVMSLLNMPCSKCSEDTYKRLALNNKFLCLKSFFGTSPIFENSKLTKKKIDKIQKWCHMRNELIHNLYLDPTSTEELMQGLKKYADRGYEYSNWMYNECSRLRRLRKQKPELFEKINFECHDPRAFCLNAIEESKEAV